MRAFFTLFSGSSKHIGERDLTRREAAVLTMLMATLLIMGLFPGQTVGRLEHVTQREAQPVTVVQTLGVSPDARRP